MKYIPEIHGKRENVFVLHLGSPNNCVIGKTDFTYNVNVTYSIFLFHQKAMRTAFFQKNYYFCLIYQ